MVDAPGHQIFISHAEQDAGVAQEIADGLERVGYAVWFYERDSLPGATYLSQVAKAIEQAECMVVVVSQQALASNMVTNEIVRAYEGNKCFVPILYGLTHAEFQATREDWRQCLGAATSVILPPEGASSVVPRIAQGLSLLGIEPGRTRGSVLSRPQAGRPSSETATRSVQDTSPADRLQRVRPSTRLRKSRVSWRVARVAAGAVGVAAVAVVAWLLVKSAGDKSAPAISPSAAPEEVIYEYFKAVNDGKPDRAYSLTSREYQAKFSYSEWAAKVLDLRERYYVVSCSTTAGDAEGSGYKILRVVHDIVNGDSTRVPILVEMKDDGRGWRIKSIRSSR